MIHKVFWNTAEKCWSIEKLTDEEFEKAPMPVRDDPFWYFGKANDAVDCIHDIHSRGDEVKKCKDCGKYFFFSRNERDWYDMQALQYPKRCYICRCICRGKRRQKGDTK